MDITTEQIKELRGATGAGIMDCREALENAGGDFDKAVDYLRQKGLSKAAKRAEREAFEGTVELYSHGGGRVGVMVKVNCETDFVAKTDDYQALVKDVAMHIAATNPAYVSRDDIPQEVIDKEKEIYASQVTNKPPQVVEKIIEGKLEKFFSDACLVDQVFVKDPDQKKKIRDLITDMIAKLGENILIKRFARFQLGEKAG